MFSENRMEYDSQEVVDNAYRHSYKILEYILKNYPNDHELIMFIKNLTYYLEDYAFWKNQ